MSTNTFGKAFDHIPSESVVDYIDSKGQAARWIMAVGVEEGIPQRCLGLVWEGGLAVLSANLDVNDLVALKQLVNQSLALLKDK